jgi:predicted Zn-dependent protease
MKHSLLKDIVFSAVVVLFSVGGYQYMEKNNWDWKSLFTGDLFKQRPVETTSMNTSDDVVYICGLGDVSNSKLEFSKQTIEDFYGIPCVVDGNVDIKSSYYSGNSGMLDVNVLLKSLNENRKVVYITNKSLYDPDMGQEVKGLTILYGNVSFVNTNTLKSTLIHEFAHTLGVDHCKNEGCAMIVNDGGYTEQLCSKCTNDIKTNKERWNK